MIAPLRQPESRSGETDTLTRARWYVAETLLAGRLGRQRRAAPIAGWKGWLLAGWIASVVVCCFGRALL